MTKRRLMFHSVCGESHLAEVMFDPDGWPTDVKFIASCDGKDRHLDGMVSEGGQALAIALAARSWEDADRIVEAVLRRNDASDGAPEDETPEG